MCPDEAASALRLNGVRRSFATGLGFRKREVLHGVDLEVARGSTLGLVGPNGSGKSTLLRIAAGVDRPSAGSVRVFGLSPSETRARERLAYLPEDSPFPGELSGPAVMDLLGALHGKRSPEIRPRARELLSLVGLTGAGKRPLRGYSRGMLRRFGLAQAFLCDPELVLLDEPTAGLDAEGFAVLDDLLERARERGAAVVLASHLLSDVHDHCARLAILVEGRVAAQGTPSDLLGTDGRVRLELEGLDEERLAELDAWVVEHGGHIVQSRAAGRSMLELYREYGATDTSDGTRR